MKRSSSTTEKAGLFDSLSTARAMGEVFCDRARLQALLDFEAALARAEADAGAIPKAAAEVIATCCRAELFDPVALAEGAGNAGNLAIPVVRALTALVAARGAGAAAAGFVHWGATSQDAIDTGMVLQLRRALGLIAEDLGRLADVLARLAQQHRRTLLLGRTLLQAGPPVTLGLKAAGWLSAIERHRGRMRELGARVLVSQFGGAVGTLASLGPHALPVAIRLGQLLDLEVPDLPWHSQRDRVAETGAVLGLLTGTLGKIARDISLLMQSEVAEVFEPRAPERGGSSSMPHKRNPIGAAAILASATKVPGLVSTLLSAMPQEHERGLGGWQVEWDTLPEICLLCAGALKHALEVCEGLQVDAARMRVNIASTLGIVMAEPLALALARGMDRAAANGIVEQACRRATAEHRPLREVIGEEHAVTSRLPAEELDRLCDPDAYLGLADTWIDRVLASRRRPETEDGE
jgi:3-carboxy-cis,cis-muconate cycloisomerase